MLRRALATTREMLAHPRRLIPNSTCNHRGDVRRVSVCGGQTGVFQAPGDSPLLFAAFVPATTAIYAFWACLNAAIFLELLADYDRRLAEEAAPA